MQIIREEETSGDGRRVGSGDHRPLRADGPCGREVIEASLEDVVGDDLREIALAVRRRGAALDLTTFVTADLAALVLTDSYTRSAQNLT